MGCRVENIFKVKDREITVLSSRSERGDARSVMGSPAE